MAITINGSGTISGISAGGLPDGSVTAADIESSLDLSGKTVTLPSGTGGKVLQVVQSTYATDTTITSTNDIDTGHEVSITPSSSSNKILLISMAEITCTGDANFHMTIRRDSTDILNAYTGAGNFGSSSQHGHGYSWNYLDSPATTSAVTYKVRLRKSTAGTNIRYSSEGNSVAVLIAMEIAG